jgi:hypothetical protein
VTIVGIVGFDTSKPEFSGQLFWINQVTGLKAGAVKSARQKAWECDHRAEFQSGRSSMHRRKSMREMFRLAKGRYALSQKKSIGLLIICGLIIQAHCFL